MYIEPILQIKRILDAHPGELVVIELRARRALAIVLSKEPKSSLIGVIWSDQAVNDFSPPFAYIADAQYIGQKECLSYGAEWVLEAIPGAESFPGNDRVSSVPGVLTFGLDASTVYFSPLNTTGWADGYLFDLKASKIVEMVRGTPFLQWRIWANQDHRLRLGADPLMEFKGELS